MSEAGLESLRTQKGLTWRELDVLVAYYLPPPGAARVSRRQLASMLALSDHTLRHHVRRLRRKLGMVSRRRRAGGFDWPAEPGVSSGLSGE